MINDKADEVIQELFQSLLFRYQLGFEATISFLIMFIYCITKFHKINFKRGGSYIDSPDWIKNEKAKLNLINKKR